MSTENKAEGVIETDELPISKPTIEQPEIVDKKEEVVIPEKKEPEKTEPEQVPENIESDENIALFKKPEEAKEEVKEEISETSIEIKIEDIFTEEILKPEESVEETIVENDSFVNEFLTETKEIFGDIKVKSGKELADIVKEEIEKSKTKTEIDTSKYTSEQIALHNHLQSGKAIKEFADITQPFENFLSLSDDDKMRNYLIYEKGMKEDQLTDEFDRLVENDEWDKTIESINKTIVSLRDNTVNERIAKLDEDYKILNQKQTQVVQKEREQLISALDEVKEFMGTPIPDEFKTKLKNEIVSGSLTQKNNNASTQIKARIFDLVGEKIYNQLTEKKKVEIDQAYNRGLEKGQGTLHNKPIKLDIPGHMKTTPEQKDEKQGFRDIENDTIKT